MRKGLSEPGRTTLTDNFQKNLRWICGYYKSISEVCRKIGINRQQFNKYLNGTSEPSEYNMRLICNFFGVEEYEILKPHNEFKYTIDINEAPAASTIQTSAQSGEDATIFSQKNNVPDMYQGYYYKYYQSFSDPGKILKAFVHIYTGDGASRYKRIERLRNPANRTDSCFVFKYVGIAQFLRDRIFLIDSEILLGAEISQTILYPTFKSRLDVLHGLLLGVAGRASREPVCARVLMEYLGKEVNLKTAMKQTGLYDFNSPDITDKVKDAILNDVRPGETCFRAYPR